MLNDDAKPIDALWTADDVARRLVCPRGRIPYLVKRGAIPCIHLPDGSVRFSEDAIERWLTELSSSPDGEKPQPVSDEGGTS